MTRIALFVLLLLVACSRGSEFDRRLDLLRATIGSHPIAEGAAGGFAAEKAELESLASEIGRLADRKSSARLDWQAGECHRLRHLFDEPGAWEEAERRFSIALARDPRFAPAHLSLGQLYLTGGFELLPRAEQEFVRALEDGGAQPIPEAQRGLFLAYYFQGQWEKALKQADRYLAGAEGDVDVRKMRAMAETNLAATRREKKS